MVLKPPLKIASMRITDQIANAFIIICLYYLGFGPPNAQAKLRALKIFAK